MRSHLEIRRTGRHFSGTGGWLLVAAGMLLGTAVNAGCAARSSAATTPKSLNVADWATVMQVQPGTSVKIYVRSGATIAGKVLTADPDYLTVEDRGRNVVFAKRDIRRVAVQQRETGRFARRGLAFGALAGALLGALTTESSRVPWALMLASGWGGVGAAIGAIDGSQERREVVIYLAPDEHDHH